VSKDTQHYSTESTLSPKQIQVIEALASGASVVDAARKAGVDRSTIYLWMKNDGYFGAELNVARRECVDTMRARLRELSEEAVKTVRELMTGTDVSAAVRLRAALSVLQSMGAMDESQGTLAMIERGRESYDPFRSVFLGALARKLS
jgi:transposase-like protein